MHLVPSANGSHLYTMIFTKLPRRKHTFVTNHPLVVIGYWCELAGTEHSLIISFRVVIILATSDATSSIASLTHQ